ncbi:MULTISPECIES: hypothetical protein [unclassified Marinobacter]|uniref:hypothetical protein n=1 Tax=unclassified Marinobacter TaxID=83889 RepID=UPI001926AFEB|nr:MULTISPECIES: hypothetical protein [unclassified Marinobacter]MBL3825177.1 hypothetical protein [Marinobacter sp. MC3]MBL3893619.1 hypothetical protein [Marinobacter sp. MW3]
METIGSALMKFGYTAFFVSGTWGFGLSLWIIHDWGGFWAAVGAIMLFPAAFTVAPIYAGFWLDDWLPMIASFGLPLISFAVILVGTSLAGRD